MLRFVWVALALVGLSGCASLGVSSGSTLRAIDFASDDVASLLLAFDMPETLEPMEEGPAISFDVTAGGESRHLRAVLTPADAEELAGTLPPPRDGRLYYLFGFSDADKAAIRDTQAWAKSLPAGQGGGLSVALEPRFCAIEEVDPAKVRFTVLVALPGSGSLKPLAQDQPLGPALQAIGATLPLCEGHSG
jgi:hypothetical protein